MEEILASIRRIIEGGEERPALAQRTRERLAASAARTEAERERAMSGGFEPSAATDDAPQPRLFAPANGVQRREAAARTWDASPSDTPEDPATRSPDEAGADAMHAAFEVRSDDASQSPSAGPEVGDAAPDTTSEALPQVDLQRVAFESAAPDSDAVLAATALAHAYHSDPRKPAEHGHEARTTAEAAPVEQVHSSAPQILLADRVDETVPVVDDNFRASFAELPDFSLEFDEESFSAELRDEVGFVPSAGQRPDAGLAEALAEAADASAPAFSAPTSVIAETSSLMSAEAGAQVAAAFDDLAGAIRDGQMKSMEEMTRQMLRPMLQEWLDDNLPRLVEKLVREEIERVSRGGRR